jgi:hypothetical protein
VRRFMNGSRCTGFVAALFFRGGGGGGPCPAAAVRVRRAHEAEGARVCVWRVCVRVARRGVVWARAVREQASRPLSPRLLPAVRGPLFARPFIRARSSPPPLYRTGRLVPGADLSRAPTGPVPGAVRARAAEHSAGERRGGGAKTGRPSDGASEGPASRLPPAPSPPPRAAPSGPPARRALLRRRRGAWQPRKRARGGAASPVAVVDVAPNAVLGSPFLPFPSSPARHIPTRSSRADSRCNGRHLGAQEGVSATKPRRAPARPPPGDRTALVPPRFLALSLVSLARCAQPPLTPAPLPIPPLPSCAASRPSLRPS